MKDILDDITQDNCEIEFIFSEDVKNLNKIEKEKQSKKNRK